MVDSIHDKNQQEDEFLNYKISGANIEKEKEQHNELDLVRDVDADDNKYPLRIPQWINKINQFSRALV